HGSTADQQFLRNFLKSEFVADAPGNQSNTWYRVDGIHGTLFGGLSEIRFDNGTQGTWNVSWPDVLRPVEGGAAVLRYTGVSGEDVAGVAYRGPFPRAERAGAVVVMGFPFETIYPAATRTEMMGRILSFLGDPEGTDTGIEDHIGDGFGPGDPVRPGEYQLHQNYPNPFNNRTVIAYQLPEASDVQLTVYSLEGRAVAELFRGFQPAGRHSVAWDAPGLASGVYVCLLTAGPLTLRRKMTLLK
ncbi:MAG: T9SS C-terminal target domain-containing protein, partial [Balneolaceae bacterium]